MQRCGYVAVVVCAITMIAFVRTSARRDPVLSGAQFSLSAMGREGGDEETRNKGVGSILPFGKATNGRRSVPERPAVEQFEQWADEYFRASALERRAMEQGGLKSAKQRRGALREIIKSDPETALKLAIRYGVRR